MVNLINSWAKGIILAVIISAIIEIILPEGNNKKYVKTIIGIYILFVMVHPLITKVSNKNIDINSIIKHTTSKMNEYETKDLAIDTNAYIEQTYIDKLREDMEQKLKEKGYYIQSLNLNIETKDEEKYGEIKNINMQIAKIEQTEEEKHVEESTVNKIAEVEVKISETNEQEIIENIEVLQDEIESLKEYLHTEYGTSKENIHINE